MTGPFLGRPRSASFRLNDLVGMDIMADIASNLRDRCADDEYKANLNLPRSVMYLIENGALGQKSGKGYFLREGKSFSALDLETLLYRDTIEPDLPAMKAIEKKPLGERIRLALQDQGDLGEFMRRHLIPVFQYADAIRHEISHNVLDFDRVMMWGFGWEMGPFAMMDAIGHDAIGVNPEPFYRENEMRAHSGGWEKIMDEPDYRTHADFSIKESHENFQVYDLDGVPNVVFKTKLGTITPALVRELTPWVEKQTEPFIISSNQRFFSVGYDLTFFLDRVAAGDFEGVDQGLKELHDLCDLLRQRKCLAAVHGYCLGAGFEIAIACSAILAHPEAQIGLPEAKVGLFPGGSGCARMRAAAQSSAKDLVEMVKSLAQGITSTCAADAKKAGLLRAQDRILLHPDRLVVDSRKMVEHLTVEGLPEWKTIEGPLTGMIDRELEGMVKAGTISDYDAVIGQAIKEIFSKSVSWQNALEREREEFIHLLKKGQTVARIKHMLETGKPLRN